MNEKPLRREDVMERQVGTDHMLYDTQGRQIHVLNPSAYFVWQRCDGDHTLGDMVEAAVEAAGIPPEEARADIGECVDTLRRMNLLQTHPA